MVSNYNHQHLAGLLIILLVVLLSACSSNPTKKDEPEDSYESLYSGSSENKTANEAAIAAVTPEEAIERGDEAFSKGQYDIALYEYVDALKLNGGDAETLNKVGDIHFTLTNYTSAKQAYNASLALDDNNQHALQGLGLIQLRTREYEKAKINLENALGLNQSLWHAHNGLGTIADIKGDYAAAIDHYQRALQLNPRSAQILNNLGYSEYLSGNWHAAMMHFVQSVNSNPNFDRAWYNIGLMYTRQGNYEDAFVAFRNVLDTPQAYNDIGYLSMMDGHYDVAEFYFQKAVKSSPSYYLKAHENIDKLDRIKRQGNTASYRQQPTGISQKPGNGPATDTEEVTAVAYSETGKPVVTVATAPKNSVVELPSEGLSNKPAILIATTEVTNNNGLVDLPVNADTTDSAPAVESVMEPADDMPGTDTSPTTPADPAIVAPVIVAAPELSPTDTRMENSAEPPEVIEDTTPEPVINKAPDPYSYSDQNEQSEYRKALALVRDGEFEDAAEAFDLFLKKYPGSSYADNANYWIGETYYVTRDFEPALQVFTGLIEDYSDSPKVPDTRLKIGYIHYEQNNWAAAQDVLTSIIDLYPDTEVAQLASARLMRMEDEGH